MKMWRRTQLKKREGVSNIALATLLSIVMMLVYLGIMNGPGGAEKLFTMIFEFFRFFGMD